MLMSFFCLNVEKFEYRRFCVEALPSTTSNSTINYILYLLYIVINWAFFNLSLSLSLYLNTMCNSLLLTISLNV